jgi:uncharacterized membrane protein YqaE (UPF0057 family)
MKKNSTSYYALLILTGTVVLTSCSISITKRHYRSGYYVDLGSGKSQERKASGNLSPFPSAESKVEIPENDSKNFVFENKMPESPQENAKVTPFRSTSKKQKSPVVTNFYASKDVRYLESEKEVSEYTFVPYSTSDDKSQEAQKEASISAPFWVIILFSILIPPLGVALKFGIIDKFWICLLLTLLFWLPGAIYALIVVTE